MTTSDAQPTYTGPAAGQPGETGLLATTNPPSVIDTPERTAPAPAPAPTYPGYGFAALFDDFESANGFMHDPYFRHENPHQQGTVPVIAKAAGHPFVVAWMMYLVPAELTAARDAVRAVLKQYRGWLDGETKPEPEPEPEPAQESSTAVERPAWGS